MLELAIQREPGRRTRPRIPRRARPDAPSCFRRGSGLHLIGTLKRHKAAPRPRQKTATARAPLTKISKLYGHISGQPTGSCQHGYGSRRF